MSTWRPRPVMREPAWLHGRCTPYVNARTDCGVVRLMSPCDGTEHRGQEPQRRGSTLMCVTLVRRIRQTSSFVDWLARLLARQTESRVTLRTAWHSDLGRAHRPLDCLNMRHEMIRSIFLAGQSACRTSQVTARCVPGRLPLPRTRADTEPAARHRVCEHTIAMFGPAERTCGQALPRARAAAVFSCYAPERQPERQFGGLRADLAPAAIMLGFMQAPSRCGASPRKPRVRGAHAPHASV